jgi:two-component system sensor histidine kinase CiaH
MKFFRPPARSLRLAFTYLAIMMVMSTCFSAVLYQTSDRKLRTQLQLQPALGLTMKAPVEPRILNENNIITIRDSLLRALLLLNGGVLLVGGGLSYYLARRTLQPIERAIAAQSQFAADASHELRTPLAVMQAEIEITLRQSKVTPERAVAALHGILKEISALTQLTEALLQVSYDTYDHTFSRVSLSEITGLALNQAMKPAQAKRISINDHVPNLYVLGDKSGLSQALSILLDNAVKFSPVKSTIHITAKAIHARVLIRVEDEGPGIQPRDLPHIFKRFYQATRTDSDSSKPSGHGLGLSIARGIINRHHGNISVANRANGGAVFTIALTHMP